jgi:hypothetical protein
MRAAAIVLALAATFVLSCAWLSGLNGYSAAPAADGGAE